MIVGMEWLIEAFDCDAVKLRDVSALQSIFAQIITDLELKTVGEPNWHKFGGEGGITGLTMLTESHLACHTYPEHKTATFNLYCCRTRPEWNWSENLQKIIGADQVKITKIERGKASNAGNASVPLAVSGASRVPVSNKNHPASNFPDFDFNRTKINTRGFLPHWKQNNAVYFVTFRLADSLPKDVLEQIEFEREQSEKNLTNLQRDLKPEEKNRLEKIFSAKYDGFLDNGYGECHLKNPTVAEMVEESLMFYDEKKYRLFAWCIMPNHVHAVLHIFPRQDLSEITHSWKSFTAHEANKILKRTGKFWQSESFDRIVRDEAEFYRTIEYILENPVKAGLQNWRWVGVKDVSENRRASFGFGGS